MRSKERENIYVMKLRLIPPGPQLPYSRKLSLAMSKDPEESAKWLNG